jgi:uncharacterized RDD family membrane protein YckC
LARQDDEFWRQEVISRVQQHRARRRRPFEPHANMELDFPARGEPEEQKSSFRPPALPEQPKIIEFPRPVINRPIHLPPSYPREPEDFELAEPVNTAPRILDAPEPLPQQIDLLSAFADIQLEAGDTKPTNQVELPLQPAAVGHRLFSGVVDLMVVLVATGLFTFGFLTGVHRLPEPRLSLLYGLGVTGTLWLVYQYLFLVYSPGTPGMQLAQLELCTFEGGPVTPSLRRWRALASLLSALALGLGFAWALIDEDTLGWHDRITQTHLKRSNHPQIG